MGEISKEDAAKYLGCSVRQVERYTSENRLGVTYVKGRAKPSPRYDEGELERFKAELSRELLRPSWQQGAGQEEAMRPDTTALSLHVASEDQVQVLAARVLATLLQAAQRDGQSDVTRHDATTASHDVALSRPQVLVGEKLLLDLGEAQALTGLSRAHLRAAVDAGELQAKKIGRGWKVRRTDLEKYLEGLF